MAIIVCGYQCELYRSEAVKYNFLFGFAALSAATTYAFVKDFIVWSESICPSLTRWVLEFGFQVDISLECRPFEKLNRLNRIRLCGFLKNDLPGLDLKIR
jgi:hypothetical protein